MKDVFLELSSHIKDHAIINTHSHHLEDEAFREFNLDALLTRSYVNWSGLPIGRTAGERSEYLEKVRYKSYFVWLQKSLQELYGLEGPLTAPNWDLMSERIRDSHMDPNHHIELLQKACGYEKIILDTYWAPGGDNGHSELFAPTFRVDPLFFGYGRESCDHNGLSPLKLYGVWAENLEEYVAFVKSLIARKKQQGCVALKCGVAYDRGLNFREVSREEAARVLKRNPSEQTDRDIAAFQDYLFYRICEAAAEEGLPLQCHTGLGSLKGTNAMVMREAIEKNPDTKFVLFHGSFPWTEDICALLHNYKNVYPDICWLPILSQTSAGILLNQLLEIGTSDKVCWGCDTWSTEESYGALLALRHVLASVLADKVRDGYFTLEDAKVIADNILYNNAKRLYFQ